MSEANLDTGGTETTPKVPDSKTGDSGFDAAKLQSSLEALSSKVDAFAKTVSTIQSGKDHAVQDVRKEVGELRTLIKDYEGLKSKLGEDGAIDQLELKQTLTTIQTQIAQLTGQIPAKAAGNGGGGAEEVARIMGEYGLSSNDPAVAPLYEMRGDALKAAAADMAFRKAKQTPPDISAAGSINSSGAGTGLNSQDVEKMAGELKVLYRNPDKNKKKIKEYENMLEPYLPS
jgi:hypothetical protein